MRHAGANHILEAAHKQFLADLEHDLRKRLTTEALAQVEHMVHEIIGRIKTEMMLDYNDFDRSINFHTKVTVNAS